MRLIAALLLVATAACQGPGGRAGGAGRAPLVVFEAGPPLRLMAAPGVRINARLKPALELEGGMVLRFDSPYLTADSAYFAAPPTAALPSGPRRGTLRVSVCPSGERLCRSLEMTVAW